MSIDARVWRIDVNDDGSGSLHLEARPGADEGPGQKVLKFLAHPAKIHALTGKCVWGGTGFLMLGTRQIAVRAGYEMLVFEEDRKFEEAIRAAKWKTLPETR